MNEIIKCPVCGKEFSAAPYHAYKIFDGHVYRRVCTWSCLRAYERTQEGKRKYNLVKERVRT